MRCARCGGTNISYHAVSIIKPARRGFFWWLFIGWWWVPVKWFFFFWWALLFKLFGSRRYKSYVHSEAVCQNCGHHWRHK